LRGNTRFCPSEWSTLIDPRAYFACCFQHSSKYFELVLKICKICPRVDIYIIELSKYPISVISTEVSTGLELGDTTKSRSQNPTIKRDKADIIRNAQKRTRDSAVDTTTEEQQQT
jgi:hypothetical protein